MGRGRQPRPSPRSPPSVRIRPPDRRAPERRRTRRGRTPPDPTADGAGGRTAPSGRRPRGPFAYRLDQRAAAEGLVGYDEDGLHCWLTWLGRLADAPTVTGLASAGGLKI